MQPLGLGFCFLSLIFWRVVQGTMFANSLFLFVTSVF